RVPAPAVARGGRGATRQRGGGHARARPRLARRRQQHPRVAAGVARPGGGARAPSARRRAHHRPRAAGAGAALGARARRALARSAGRGESGCAARRRAPRRARVRRRSIGCGTRGILIRAPQVKEASMQTVGVEVGQIAPDFTLKGPGGQPISLSDYRGRSNVVLVFFPLAFSPVCSHQLPAVQRASAGFEAAAAVVLGVSVDSHHANAAFAEKLGLTFPLLSDFDRAVSAAYGVLNAERGYSGRALFALD